MKMAISLKKQDFYRFWNCNLAATSNPNLMVETALERWKSVFYKNQNFKDIRPHLQFKYGVFEAVSFCNVQKIHLSSILAEIKGDWGRVEVYNFLEKYGSSAFQRRVGRIIWARIRWDIRHWSLLNFQDFQNSLEQFQISPF